MNKNLKLIVSNIPIPKSKAVKVKDCFKNVYYRDSDFDSWLPKTMPAMGSGNASGFELVELLKFKEMFEGADSNAYWSLAQIDKLIKNCKAGENPFQLRTDGYSNIFFVEANGEVFAVHAYRSSDGWLVNVFEFEISLRWHVGDRVFFRNCSFEPLNLENRVLELEKQMEKLRKFLVF